MTALPYGPYGPHCPPSPSLPRPPLPRGLPRPADWVDPSVRVPHPPTDAERARRRPTPMWQALLLAGLLHLWLALVLGSVPPGSAVPGQGVWGAINLRLQPQGEGPPNTEALPAPPLPATGLPGDAPTPRWGGAVRTERPAPDAPPGAARQGDWAPQAAAGAEGDESALRMAPADAGATAAPALPVSPIAAGESSAQPAAQDVPPLPPLAALAAVPALPAIPAIPALETGSDVAPAPSAPFTPLSPATLGASLQRVPDLPALQAPDPRLAPSLAAPAAALAGIERLPALAALQPPAALPPLPAPVALPAAAPASAAASVSPGAATAAPTTAPTAIPTAAPTAAPAAPLMAAPTTAAPTTAPMAAPTAAPAAASTGAPTAAPAARGLPDAGTRQGADVATAPSAPASAPKLNLQLPRSRGGELSALGSTGLLAVMPRPPEVQREAARAAEKPAPADCRLAHAKMGLLAVVPLAADALKAQGGCRW